jgi:hypothetical protein
MNDSFWSLPTGEIIAEQLALWFECNTAPADPTSEPQPVAAPDYPCAASALAAEV